MICILCQIIEDKAPCHKVWGDEHRLVFLSIFPSTDGFTVMISRKHYPSYAFDVPPQALADLMLAAQKAAERLGKAFPDISHTKMLFESFSVNHVHSKLGPMYGTGNLTHWKPTEARQNKFFKQYEGYLPSHDRERADDAKLATLAVRTREA